MSINESVAQYSQKPETDEVDQIVQYDRVCRSFQKKTYSISNVASLKKSLKIHRKKARRIEKVLKTLKKKVNQSSDSEDSMSDDLCEAIHQKVMESYIKSSKKKAR